MDVNQTVKDIKAQFRLYMNGIASQSMREKGLGYKLNFGIELPRIKEIANKYEKNHQLAQELWKENIRECKVMATLLQPVDSFYTEIADIWMDDVQNSEIAELLCMNLLQNLPYASQKSFEWIASDRKYYQFCGYMVMARLLMKGMVLNERAEAELLDQAIVSLQEDDMLIKRAASTVIKKFAHQNKDNAKKVNKFIAPLLKSAKDETALAAEDIKLDIEY